jgi:hypothetical protein
MTKLEQASNINKVLIELRNNLEKLEAQGKGVPAVEKGVERMSGTLNTLEVQFAPLINIL